MVGEAADTGKHAAKPVAKLGRGKVLALAIVALVAVALIVCLVRALCPGKAYEVTFDIDGSLGEGGQVTTTIVLTKNGKELSASSVEGLPGEAAFELENGTYAAVVKISVTREDKTYSAVSTETTFKVQDADLSLPCDVTDLAAEAILSGATS